MRFFTTKHSFLRSCIVAFASAAILSCGGDHTSLSNQEVAELQKQLDSTMQLYQQVKSQNLEFDKQMSSRDSAINAQAAEIQRLINSMNSTKTAPKSNVRQGDEKQIAQQQKELRDKENTIKQLRKQIEQQQQQISTLQSDVKKGSDAKDVSANYKSQIAQLQKQIDEQEKQINNLKSQAKNAKNAASEANCDQVKKSYESQVADLNGEIKNYKVQISDLNKEIESLKADVTKLKSEASTTDEAANSELQSARAELTNLTRQLNDCRKLNTQYQNDVKAATDNLASAKAELAKCQSDLDIQVAQVKSLSAQQSEGGKNEQQLRAELALMTQKEASLRAQNEELENSQRNLNAKCESDKATLSAKITSLQNQVANMQGRIDKLTADNEELQAKSSAKQEETSTGNDMQDVANLRKQVEAQYAEIERLESELHSCKDQLKQRDADLDAARKEAATAKSSGNASKSTVNQKLAELQALCDSYVAEIERLRAENEQLKNENSALKEKVAGSAELFAENERLQQKVKLASVLVTTDLKVTPGKDLKTGNVVKPTNKASQTKVIRIDCRLVDNNVIDPGAITIFARIANAANRVVCNENYTFDLNGTTMQYTTTQDIEFTGYGRNLVMIWRKNDSVELTPGLYWVTLYANGYEIGKVSFKLE